MPGHDRFTFMQPPDVAAILDSRVAARGERGGGRGATGSRAAVASDLIRAGALVTGEDGRGREPRWLLVDTEPERWTLEADTSVCLLATDWNEWSLTVDGVGRRTLLSTGGTEVAQSWALDILRARALEILGAVGLGGGQ